MRRSTAANRADWIAAPDYGYMERTRNDDGTKTYDVTMILGSSYKRLVKDGDTLLSAAEQAKEEWKLRAEIAKREAESPDQRASSDRRLSEEARARAPHPRRDAASFRLHGRRDTSQWVRAPSTSFGPLRGRATTLPTSNRVC